MVTSEGILVYWLLLILRFQAGRIDIFREFDGVEIKQRHVVLDFQPRLLPFLKLYYSCPLFGKRSHSLGLQKFPIRVLRESLSAKLGGLVIFPVKGMYKSQLLEQPCKMILQMAAHSVA